MAEILEPGTTVTWRGERHNVHLDTGGTMLILRNENRVQVGAFRHEISLVSENQGCVIRCEPPSL